jgi:predicted molibdopterin-dependent oxidoreductase YjgC
MRSNNVDTSARQFYGPGFNAYVNLLKMSATLADVHKASTILCVGLDTRFARSVVGVALRKATKRGVKIITIHPRPHNLTVVADKWLQPLPGEEAGLLRKLAELTATNSIAQTSFDHEQDPAAVAETLRNSTAPIILVGSEFLQYDASSEIFDAIARIAKNLKAGVLPLPSHNNLYGSIVMGAYGELLPGGHAMTDAGARKTLASHWGTDLPIDKPVWNASSLSSGTKTKVLYLVGEVPFDSESNAEYVIFQNIYPPDGFCHADLVLPAAAYTEADGSFINGEGRVQRLKKGVAPPGGALPDWQILCRIAQKMDVAGFDFASIDKIREEVVKVVGKLGRFEEFAREPNQLGITGELLAGKSTPQSAVRRSEEFPFLLTVSAVEHSHRGFPLSAWVEGSKMLLTEEMLEINPADAKDAGIARGDEVIVISNHFERTLPAKLAGEQPAGTLHASLREHAFFNPNPHPVRIRRKTCSG